MRAGINLLAVVAVYLLLIPAGALAESNYPHGTPSVSDLNASVNNTPSGFGDIAALNGQHWPDIEPQINSLMTNDYVRARLGTTEIDNELNLFDSLASQSWPDAAPN
jgi:hypothetical protein